MGHPSTFTNKGNCQSNGEVNCPTQAKSGLEWATLPELEMRQLWAILVHPRLASLRSLFCLGLPAQDWFAGGGGFVQAREAGGVGRVLEQLG